MCGARRHGPEAQGVGGGRHCQAGTVASFDGNVVDLSRSVVSYYQRSGQSIEVPSTQTGAVVAEAFDAAALRNVRREAQAPASGHRHKDFCDEVAGTGCTGFAVSLSGRRAGREPVVQISAEFHPATGT